MVQISTYREVPLAQIYPSLELRAHEDEDEDLIKSIQTTGLRVPLSAMERSFGSFQVLIGGGNRRLRALRAMRCPGSVLVSCRVVSLATTPYGDDLVFVMQAPGFHAVRGRAARA